MKRLGIIARAGEGPTAVNARKTHCNYGHEFTEENTYWFRGARLCRQCHRRRNHKYDAKRRGRSAR